MRLRARRDESEKAIVEALEAHGFTVERMDKPVDLLIAKRGWTGVAEAKTGKGKLRPSQVKFMAKWPNPVFVLRTVEDVQALARRVGKS